MQKRACRLPKYLLFLFLMVTYGCGTFLTQFSPLVQNKGEDGCYKNEVYVPSWMPQMYSGTLFDLWSMTDLDVGHGYGCTCAIPDLPLSLVADTVILPITIYRQVKCGNIKNDTKESQQ